LSCLHSFPFWICFPGPPARVLYIHRCRLNAALLCSLLSLPLRWLFRSVAAGVRVEFVGGHGAESEMSFDARVVTRRIYSSFKRDDALYGLGTDTMH
jgi:hypothetical protein